MDPVKDEKGKWIYPIILRKPKKDRGASSVKLIRGYVSRNPGMILSERCKLCQIKPPKLITVNHTDSNIMLYGCNNRGKCKNILIKIVMP